MKKRIAMYLCGVALSSALGCSSNPWPGGKPGQCVPAQYKIVVKDGVRYLIVRSGGPPVIINIDALPPPPPPPDSKAPDVPAPPPAPTPPAPPVSPAPPASSDPAPNWVGCDCRLPECDPMCMYVLQATRMSPVQSCTPK